MWHRKVHQNYIVHSLLLLKELDDRLDCLKAIHGYLWRDLELFKRLLDSKDIVVVVFNN